MDDAKALVMLKDRVEALTHQASKAAGALDRIMSQLRGEFGCASLKAAERKLTSLRRQEDEAKESFRKALRRFEREYGDDLPVEED